MGLVGGNAVIKLGMLRASLLYQANHGVASACPVWPLGFVILGALDSYDAGPWLLRPPTKEGAARVSKGDAGVMLHIESRCSYWYTQHIAWIEINSGVGVVEGNVALVRRFHAAA